MKLSIKISPANSKLGRIPNISTIPVKDCTNCDLCKKDCYALKAWKQYPAVRNAWKTNSKAFRNDPATAFADLHAYISKKKPKFFRIHVAGDFLNQLHVAGYAKLAYDNPDTKFLAFTKCHDLSYSDIPDNLQIVISMWPGMPIPDIDLPKAWVQDGTESRVPDTAIECPGICDDCGMCWQLSKLDRDVVFNSH